MYYAVVVSSCGNTENKAPPTRQEPELGVSVTDIKDRDPPVTLGLSVGRSVVGIRFSATRHSFVRCLYSAWTMGCQCPPHVQNKRQRCEPPSPHSLSLGVGGSHDTVSCFGLGLAQK
ncbi:hypothetical protein NDU88_004942 [Pleurodeles waltl]|uniref:Uncharacterized protein n=1 Tax=Pleurodeles waltl TaxID=8319 RepID=A0AAV7M8J7_PLEWA|nr:hypothetical protein NDU88_004942 [Pleurodeles waltl]